MTTGLLGRQLRILRQRRHLSQAAVAHQLGRSAHWYCNVECGGADLLVSEALRLADILEVDAADLFRTACGGLDALRESSEADRARQCSALGGETGVDRCLVDHVSTIGRELPGQLGRLPWPALARWARAHLRTVHALLDKPMAGALRRELESSAAQSATLAGTLLATLGWPDRAGAYLRLAIRLAASAGDGDVHALALIFASELYSCARPKGRLENPRMARALLEAAERLARHGGPVRARVLLRLAEERVFVGDDTTAQRLLDAGDCVASVSRKPSEGIVTLWHSSFTLAYRGNVARLAGRSEQAIRLLEDALLAQHPGRQQVRANIATDLCLAYVQRGDIDYACDLLSGVHAMACEASLKGISIRIRRIREQHFARYATGPAVRRLDEQLGVSA